MVNSIETTSTVKPVKFKLTVTESLLQQLQEKMVVKNLTNIPILLNELSRHENKNYWIKDKKTKIFGNLFDKITDSNWYIAQDWSAVKIDLQRDAMTIIELKNVYFRDDYYIFEAKNGKFFHANIDAFNNKWVSAESLALWKPKVNIINNNLYDKFIIQQEITWISILNKNDNKIISTVPWDLVTIIEQDKWKILIIYKNRFEVTTVNQDGTYTQDNPIVHRYGKIEHIRTDRNENFVLINTVDDEGKHNLHILNRKTLQKVDTIPDIKDIIQIDTKNDLSALSSDDKIVQIDTNFDQFPKWYADTGNMISEGEQEVVTIEDKPRSELHSTLKSGWIKISIDTKNSWSGSDEEDESDDIELREAIRNIVVNGEENKTLKSLFDEADTVKKIDMVRQALQQIKKNPQVHAVKGIMDPIETQVSKKRNEIRLTTLFAKIDSLAKELWTTDEFTTLVWIKLQLDTIKSQRKQIIVGPTPHDTQLQELYLIVDEKINEYRNQHKEEIIKDIESNLASISEYVANIEYLPQITSIYTNDLWKRTEKMISYLDKADALVYGSKLTWVVISRQQNLSQLEKKKHTNKQEMMEETVKTIQSDIGQLETILESLDEEDAVKSMQKDDPLVNKIKDIVSTLPASRSQELQIQLDNIFQQRIFKIKLQSHESKGVIKALDEYGIDTLLYYNDTKQKHIDREIKGTRDTQGNVRLQISLGGGKYVYDCDKYFSNPAKYSNIVIGGSLKFDMTQSEFITYTKELEWRKKHGKALLASLEKKLNTAFQNKNDTEKKDVLEKIKEVKKSYKQARYTDALVNKLIDQENFNPRPFVPKFDHRFLVLEEEKAILETLSVRFRSQKEEQKGIEILEGGPGLGKTDMCKFLASVTNREIIRIQCSKMDPADMFFSPALKKWETSREPADWIKLMQKPGTIVLFDEIDKLNDQCFERLHSLFDGDKAVYDPQLWAIKASIDCIFLGTRNSYEKMSNPIISRSRIKMIEYPSMQNEAFKVSKYADSEFLDSLSYDDFKNLWNKYGIRNEAAPKNVNERKTYDNIINIKHLLNIFTELRKKYDVDSFDDKFIYELSYRDAHHVFVDFNAQSVKSFKVAVEDILIPKVRAVVKSKEDKDIQSAIVKKVVDAEIK